MTLSASSPSATRAPTAVAGPGVQKMTKGQPTQAAIAARVQELNHPTRPIVSRPPRQGAGPPKGSGIADFPDVGHLARRRVLTRRYAAILLKKVAPWSRRVKMLDIEEVLMDTLLLVQEGMLVTEK
jgi:hypothetical protein